MHLLRSGEVANSFTQPAGFFIEIQVTGSWELVVAASSAAGAAKQARMENILISKKVISQQNGPLCAVGMVFIDLHCNKEWFSNMN